MSDRDEEKTTTRAGEEIDEGEVLAWTTHPLKRKPIAAAAVTVFILVVGFLVFATTESKAFGTLALVVLFASLARFYLPTKYRLSDKRIMVKSTTQTVYKNWSQYRSFYPDRNGVLLSPFVRPSRLENFRGLYLIFENNKKDVIRFVENHIGKTTDEKVSTEEESK
ncbi:MAG: hypothetical protein JSU74_12090 [Candidatus Zixiibacteriota bacterium]|nr:MAG: hypothetical protein JSU74_12090 [candidate division Zixibacteria bacterium]